MSDVTKILIAGGRIAGLTLARARYRRGFTVDLTERNRVWRAEGGGRMGAKGAGTRCELVHIAVRLTGRKWPLPR